MQELDSSPETWPPLGLPSGSVRALLTLITVAVVVSNLAHGVKPDALWIGTLLVALAHYFASRRAVVLPPDVIARLESEGVLRRERNPLFLPRHSIRAIIVLAFAGLAVYLYREGKLLEPAPLSVLGIVSAYLLGALVRGVTGWLNRRRTQSRFWGDARATIVLVAMVLAAIPELLQVPVPIPHLHEIALYLMLFYFGSR